MISRLFSAENLERCESLHGFNHRVQSWEPEMWMTAVLGEMGEAANIAKKIKRIKDGIGGNEAHETEEYLHERIGEELADVVIYLDLLATRLGLDIRKEVIKKFNKTSRKIGYPRSLGMSLAE